MKYKNILACIVCCCMFLNLSIFASAKGETTDNTDIVKIESTFTTEQKPFKNTDVKKVIEKNGKKYQLQNVTYKEITKKPIEKEVEKIVKFKEIENNVYKIGDVISVNNQDVKITKIDFQDCIITDRYNQITHSSVLGFNTDVPTVDNYVNVEFYDKYSKKTIIGQAKLDNMTHSPLEWIADVKIPLTIEVTNGDYFIFNDIKISSTNTLSDLLTNQKEVLKAFDLDTEKYRLTKFVFDGGEYKNNKGIVCQNIIATGERYGTEYIANYSTGAVDFPDCKGYEISCYYNTIDIMDNEFLYTVLATAEYVPQKNYSPIILGSTGVVGAFIIWFFALNNAVFYVNGKRVYSTKIRKNNIKANKLSKFASDEIVIKISKSYAKRHPLKTLNIVVNGQNQATITIPITTQSYKQKI